MVRWVCFQYSYCDADIQNDEAAEQFRRLVGEIHQCHQKKPSGWSE